MKHGLLLAPKVVHEETLVNVVLQVDRSRIYINTESPGDAVIKDSITSVSKTPQFTDFGITILSTPSGIR